jgi:urate oxidase
MNAAKDAFFADFEAKYKDDLNSAVESLTATKKAVVAKIDEASAAIKSATDSFGAKVDELYGDEIDYVKSAIKSTTDKIWEEIQKIPLPLP